MSLNVANCPRCGKLYMKGPFEACPACVKEIEVQYNKCADYLRSNRMTTLIELSEATDVSVRQITNFIREGRIRITTNPNMSYSCDACGNPIREGMICEACRQKLAKDASNMSEDEKRKQAQQKQENQMSFNIKDRLKDRH